MKDFYDTDHGWAILHGGGSAEFPPIDVASTTDGGKTWSSVALAQDDKYLLAGYADTGSLSFIDAERGWMLLRKMSSSAASRGDLFSTNDGGKKWSALPVPPIAGPIQFTSAFTGWVVGGVHGNELYRTEDAGRTWDRKEMTLPLAGTGPDSSVYGEPSFQGLQEGMLPVTFVHDASATLLTYSTHDGGDTWTLQKTIDLSGSYGTPKAFIAGSVAMDIGRTGNSLRFYGNSAVVSAQLPIGTPRVLFVHGAQFLDPLHAWVLLSGAP